MQVVDLARAVSTRGQSRPALVGAEATRKGEGALPDWWTENHSTSTSPSPRSPSLVLTLPEVFSSFSPRVRAMRPSTLGLTRSNRGAQRQRPDQEAPNSMKESFDRLEKSATRPREQKHHRADRDRGPR